MYNKAELSRFIKNRSHELGFSFCGITKAGFLSDQKEHLDKWNNKGYNADLDWMTRNTEKRLNPALLVDGAKSVIVVALNYYQDIDQLPNNPVFSRYALGADYHKVIKDKLHQLLSEISSQTVIKTSRIFVDSAPILEKALAQKAGLGWIGKNTLLINKNEGSYFFLGELIVDIELEYNEPELSDYCGRCTKCIDACPTAALIDGKILDSALCISYLTIEKKGELNLSESKALNGKVFGCDICQEVCPWNKNPKNSNEKSFEILPEIKKYSLDKWKKITEDEFQSIFRNSTILRTAYKSFMRNLNA